MDGAGAEDAGGCPFTGAAVAPAEDARPTGLATRGWGVGVAMSETTGLGRGGSAGGGFCAAGSIACITSGQGGRPQMSLLSSCAVDDGGVRISKVRLQLFSLFWS